MMSLEGDLIPPVARSMTTGRGIVQEEQSANAQPSGVRGALLRIQAEASAGRYQEALKEAGVALVATRRLGLLQLEAAILQEQALIFQILGQLDRAEASARGALLAFERATDNRGRVAAQQVLEEIQAQRRADPPSDTTRDS